MADIPFFNPWAAPIFANGGAAFGTGSPAEEAQRPRTAVDNVASNVGSSIIAALMAPGNALNSSTPMTSDQMVAPANALASLLTLGAGGVPAGANELRAGIRPYGNVPESLMGYRKSGPQRDFGTTNYPHTQDVEVVLPATSYAPRDIFRDQIRGMNADHALERAWRNWPNATHIRAIEQKT